MGQVLTWVQSNWGSLVRALVVICLGLPMARLAGIFADRATRRRLSDQGRLVLRKVVVYTISGALCVVVLHEFGFRLTALLGAAGIVGVAVGFASQTSLSNVVSGLFLVFEKPFQVGDAIQVDGTLGIVQSIDLLAVKMRTFDNRYVRIPNETLLKTQVVNITRFPIRRLDIDIGVAYREDVERVTEVLKDVADRNPFCLDEPEPLVLFKAFGDSALEFLFGVWFEKADMLNVRNSIMRDIKKRFDEEGIEIPFPHRSIYAGSVTEPFPIRIIHDADRLSEGAADGSRA